MVVVALGSQRRQFPNHDASYVALSWWLSRYPHVRRIGQALCSLLYSPFHRGKNHRGVRCQIGCIGRVDRVAALITAD